MATYYTKRRQDAVGNRLVAIEQRLARKYPAIDPRAPASLPEKSAGQIAGNGTLAPVPPVTAATPPQESVSGARSYRVVRAFACDDGAPIQLLYGGASIRPAVRQSEQASHHMSAATEALPPYFESFADPIDMAQPTGPIGAHGANQPAQ